jgi:hypothetical protein
MHSSQQALTQTGTGTFRLEFRCETVTLGIACSALVPGFESHHLFSCITHSFVLALLNVGI